MPRDGASRKKKFMMFEKMEKLFYKTCSTKPNRKQHNREFELRGMTLKNSKSWPLPLVQLRVDSSDGGRTYRTYAHDDCVDNSYQYVNVNISSHRRLKDDIRRWNNGYTGFNRYYDTITVGNSILSPYRNPNVIVTECQTHCDNNGRAIPSKVYNGQRENGDCITNQIEDNSKPVLPNNVRNNIEHNLEQIEIQSPKNEKLGRHDGNDTIVKTSATLFRPPVLRTDTVSTILEQETETDDVDNYDAINYYDDPTTTHHNTSNSVNDLMFNCQQHSTTPPPRSGSATFHDRYHILALARIAEHHEQHEHYLHNAQLRNQQYAASRTAQSTTREDLLYHQRRTCDLKVDDESALVCQVHQRKVTVNNSSASEKLLTVPGNIGCDCDKSCKVVGHQLQMRHQDAAGTLLDPRKVTTLKRHYYPEGGWGWIIIVCTILVHILNHGIQLSCALLVYPAAEKFKTRPVHVAGWLGAMSTGVALLISPVTIAFCRKKSTRVTAVMGGLITALGCLFTSFATQFHQLFFSYGTVVGIGVGITRDCSTLMVAQYFKRRREFVEIFIVSGSGLGIAIMSLIIRAAIGALGWRLGLQVVTGTISATFILGTFYRSASLYHPQRRAILHIKNQKRKIKDKNKVDDRVPFFDFSTLKSKTVRILLVSTGISAFGINTPLFYLAYQAESEGLSGDSTVLLQLYLGLAWTVGCVMFSTLVLHSNGECRIARQYLTQTAVLMCGLSILVFTTAVSGNYHAYVMFAWIYGIFCGGYHYSLKMYTYERVRARNFARTWGFVQCSQAIPIVIGVPFSGYISERCGDRAGYYFSSTCVIVGSLTLFLVDLHRRNIARHKHTRANGTRHLCVSETCPQRRRLSFTQEPDVEPNAAAGPGGIGGGMLVLGGGGAGMMGGDMGCGKQGGMDNANDKAELTCISEEGIADMDIPDNLLDDLDYIGDCITSCNKVENYLMLSEFENNLIAEMPVILDRKGRRWSLARSKASGPTPTTACSATNCSMNNAPAIDDDAITVMPEEHEENGCSNLNSKWNVFPNRGITVIDESSV